ncbi:SusC/RagA family TonB-linked outer membrane protein [Pedobacter sp. UBA5917]|jgi:TonB-linked SusC/RagA family outer membrane protein|uniref:SusC/RagA family TonB-linked outer membrane protein n=1 Tax=Pedobacter sp. UBA5917 TaxID=1947061 RepID=UPI0025EF1889|nr:SusC/RagA family TonB-linked outer membrane protein [Pedobacter sp. UBA5917]
MKKLLTNLFFILCLNNSYAQYLIKGRILNDIDSTAVANVTINIIPGNYSTESDANGHFQFNLPVGTYDFYLNHIGYGKQKKNIKVIQTTNLNFYLQPLINELKEVVVHTGYQDLPKERSTGSFVSINSKKLNEQFSTDVLSRLEAVANGVSVNHRSGTNGKLMVRGLSTITGPGQPLVVLDNFPYQGDLNNINPNDVESITVLKDAAASSIWGSRAGNGVIVITTKKAKAGQALSIDFNGNFSLTTKPDLYYLSQMSVPDYIGVEQFLYDKGYYNSRINSSSKPPLSPVVELLIANKKGTLSNQALQDALAKLGEQDTKRDILQTNYQNAVARQFALSLRTGGKIADWTFSAGYDANTSNLAAQSNRVNLNSYNIIRLYPWLTMDVGLRLTQSKSGNGKAGYSDMGNNSNVIYPYLSLADANGNALPIAKNYSLSYLSGLNYNLLSDWKYYPLTDYLENDIKQTIRDVVSSFGLNVTVFKGFKASVKYQYEFQQLYGRSLFGENSFAARNLVNLFTQISNTGTATYRIPKGGILDETESLLQSQNLRGQLAYNRNFGAHEINVISGAELNENRTKNSGSRLYGYNDENTTFSYADLANTYPNYVTGVLNYIDKGPADRQLYLNRFVSFYGNAAYTYKQRYTLSASARKDASNLFGLNANDKWKPLWSVGLAWNITNESFFKVNWVQELKLRGSYGYSGNVDQSKVAITTIFGSIVSPFTGTVESRFDQFVNPDLRWEQVGTFNLGVDFSVFSNRLSGSIEGYKKRATDLYGSSQVDYTAVPTTILFKNSSSMQAKGLDVLLQSKNIIGKFSWLSDVNFSLYRDKVLEVYKSGTNGSSYINGGTSIVNAKGYPVFAMFSYRWAGLDPQNGNPQGYLGGAVSTNYNAIIGSGTKLSDLSYDGPIFPTIYGNMGNTFTYGALSLTLRLNYKFGYCFRRASIDYNKLFSAGTSHADYAIRWQKPGDENFTDVPSMVYPVVSSRESFYSASEQLIEKGDHIRIAYLSITYQLNKENTKRLPFKSVQLQANASNLGIIWRANKKDLDPDYSTSTIPPSKFFSLGLRATF